MLPRNKPYWDQVLVPQAARKLDVDRITLCENVGLPILETLARGCPAIVPATCANPEVAGNAARLVDPLDEEEIAHALVEIFESDALRMQMRQRGLQWAQHFSWRQTAQRTLDVFDKILPAPTLQTRG